MEITLYILALLFSAAGVVGSILPILPGPALSLVALAIGYFSPARLIGGGELLIWLLICVVVSLLDYYLPIYMTKRFGGSKSGMVGATIGMFVGLVAFPPFGIVVGPFIGAVMGEISHNREDVSRAFAVGFGTFVAFILGTGLKILTTVWIFYLIVSSLYPLVESWVVGLFG